jgi:hypothetical protein
MGKILPCDKELSFLSNERCHSNVSAIGKNAGLIESSRSRCKRISRGGHKVSNELGFAVFLAMNLTLFGNSSTIVI